jgi:hypothetical protein
MFTMAGFLAGAMPLSADAAQMEFGVLELEQVDEQVSVTVNEQTVSVTGAQGKTLEVVSLTGKRVMSAKIEGPAQRFELNIPKGCYILKVGKVVRKITIR